MSFLQCCGSCSPGHRIAWGIAFSSGDVMWDQCAFLLPLLETCRQGEMLAHSASPGPGVDLAQSVFFLPPSHVGDGTSPDRICSSRIPEAWGECHGHEDTRGFLCSVPQMGGLPRPYVGEKVSSRCLLSFSREHASIYLWVFS